MRYFNYTSDNNNNEKKSLFLSDAELCVLLSFRSCWLPLLHMRGIDSSGNWAEVWGEGRVGLPVWGEVGVNSAQGFAETLSYNYIIDFGSINYGRKDQMCSIHMLYLSSIEWV